MRRGLRMFGCWSSLQELHSPLALDVSLEQTWLGRSLENLLQCPGENGSGVETDNRAWWHLPA